MKKKTIKETNETRYWCSTQLINEAGALDNDLKVDFVFFVKSKNTQKMIGVFHSFICLISPI